MKSCLAILLLCAAAGCSLRVERHFGSNTTSSTSGLDRPEDQQMRLEYHVRDKCAALESEHVVLMFHGLTPAQQSMFHFNGKQPVQISGQGTSSVAITSSTERGKVVFRADYADGTNTLRLNKQTVRFAESGRLLLAGDQAVDLSAGQKIVHLTDGKAVVE